MKIRNFYTKTKEFLIRKVAELLGLIIVLFGFFILISIFTYSPEDPNFILNNEAEVQNLLGLRGSIISDFLFQSVGLISYLIPFTLFFSGLYAFSQKKQIILIDNLFFCILYIIFGSLFFSNFYNQSFFLTINGNGGFVGLFFKNSFLNSIIIINKTVSYYSLILITIILFLASINFRLAKVLKFIGMFKNISFYKKKK